MLKEYYKVLGLEETATDEELERAYQTLRDKYKEDRWLEGEAGNEAAKMLTKVEVAYREITSARKHSATEEKGSSEAFEEISSLLKQGKINEAQAKLDEFNERSAEWHYLQAVVFYKKNWSNESKKQLEIAMQMDPSCVKYREAYGKLNAKNEYDKKASSAGQTTQNPYSSAPHGADEDMSGRQMGGNVCSDCCSCCYTYLCVDCLFSLCCGCR